MKYISILRGINVSGQKKIKMADLKELYLKLGFSSVITYIQSGNVIFESAESDQCSLSKSIELAIEKQYGFDVPVQIRDAEDLTEILDAIPFEEASVEENGSKILVTFLASVPSVEKVETLMGFVNSPEKLLIKGCEVYLFCPNGYGKSKLTTTFVEKKLGISATTRNWKSVKKLHELSL